MTPSVILADGVRKGTLTREQVIKKILRWNALYGEPPCTADWNPSLARWRAQEWRIERYRQGDPETGQPWPSLNSAKRLFDGSFDAAIRMAGLVPHRPGPRRRAAGVARPDVEQRAPRAPRDVEADLVAASERVFEAERRAQRAEERLRRVADRVERADDRVTEARERARDAERRANERVRAAERRAAAAERRAAAIKPERVLVEVPVPVEVEVPIEVPVHVNGNGNGNGNGHLAAAEARARAAESAAVVRRADAARAAHEAEGALIRAEVAERRARELELAISGGRPLTQTEIAALREGEGPVGPGPLAEALKALATARATNDNRLLHEALNQVASAAVRWRERL